LLRIERDKRLAAVDWMVIKAISQGLTIAPELATYMQALRDITATADPTLNQFHELDMSSVVWPEKP